MKILTENPPVYEDIIKAGLKPTNYTIYAYGDTIYNPNKVMIPQDLIVHESVHMKQQNYNDNDAKIWWERYLTDNLFRIEQEVEAYSAQYKYVCTLYKDRNKRDKMLRQLAQFLSSPMYGSVLDVKESYKLIKNYGPTKVPN